MSKVEKALSRLVRKPTDFTWSEMVSLMNSLEIELIYAAGSARKFRNPATGVQFAIHQPHPSNILKKYQVSGAIAFLRQEGFLK